MIVDEFKYLFSFSKLESLNISGASFVCRYPTTIKISRTSEDFDNEAEWPSTRLCKEAAPTFPDNLEAIYQIFLPFENKGLRYVR